MSAAVKPTIADVSRIVGACGLDIEPDNLFSLIQGYDSRLDTLESSSGVSLPYVDLRFAPYSVTPGDPSKAASNRTGIAAAIAANPSGAHLVLPSGDIYLDWNTTTTNRSAILFAGVSRFWLQGQGMFTTKLIIEGTQNLAERRGICIANGSSKIYISDLWVQHGTVVGPEEHNHLINIGIAGQTSGVTDIVVRNVYCGQSVGDGINIQGEAGAVTDTVIITNVIVRSQGIVGSSRDCVGFQRGIANVELGNFYLEGCKNSCIDFEPTGNASIVNINIHDGVCNQALSNSQVSVSVGGNAVSASTKLVRGKVHNLTVNEGQFQIFDCTDLEISNLTVYAAGASGPMAGTGLPLIYLYGDVASTSFVNTHATRDTGGIGAGEVLAAIHHVGRGNPRQVSFTDTLIVQNTSFTPVRFENTDGLTVNNMLINFGGTVTGNSGISVNANAVSMNSNQFNDVRLTVATGKMPQMFNLGTNAFNLLNITITNCSAPNAVTTGILMTEVAGGLVDKAPIIMGCDFTGGTWLAASSGPLLASIYPVIGGNKGGPRVIWGSGTPEAVVTGIVGDQFIRSDGGATTTLYVKTSGTGNTGWTGK